MKLSFAIAWPGIRCLKLRVLWRMPAQFQQRGMRQHSHSSSGTPWTWSQTTSSGQHRSLSELTPPFGPTHFNVRNHGEDDVEGVG